MPPTTLEKEIRDLTVLTAAMNKHKTLLHEVAELSPLNMRMYECYLIALTGIEQHVRHQKTHKEVMDQIGANQRRSLNAARMQRRRGVVQGLPHPRFAKAAAKAVAKAAAKARAHARALALPAPVYVMPVEDAS